MVHDLTLGSPESRGESGRGKRATDLVDLLMWLDAGALPDLAIGESRFGPDQRQYPFAIGHRGFPFILSSSR